jgi:DNA invertase Pin-like site-specific DNA recombinase
MERKAAIYCRISRDRVGAELGVDRQRDDCRALAYQLEWPVADVYKDNDTSAYSGKRRKNYERLLRDIEAGYITAVIAWHPDRLHRSPKELERYIDVCEVRSVPTYCVRSGELDLASAAGRMTARIIGAVARHESEQKGERLKRQRAQAMADGRWIGGRRPFGFEPDGVTHRPTEAAAIEGAARRILAGESVRSIMREWNSNGILTTTGREWDISGVRQMLLRPRNAGLVGNRDRIIGPARWGAIIDRDKWQALAALLKDPARRRNTSGTSRKLAGSFLYYCHHGEHVHSGGTTPTGRARYMCQHLARSAEPIDQLVFGAVERVLVKEAITLVTPAADVAPLRERAAILRAQTEEIASEFGDPDSDMTAAQFKIANKRVQDELQNTETEIGRLTSDSTLAGVADAADPVAAFRTADIDRKRAVIDTLMTVTLLRMPPGRRAYGQYFDPNSVRIEWRW